MRTMENGDIDNNGPFGPYLRSMPTNRISGLDTLRIGGGPAGDGTAGWWVDGLTGEVLADDSTESAAATKDLKKSFQLMERAGQK
jgi:hypothetical protein